MAADPKRWTGVAAPLSALARLLRLSERYFVITQTLKLPPAIETTLQSAAAPRPL